MTDPVDAFRMPLMDHLIELRRRLIYCVVIILVLFFVCYHFAPEIYGFLSRPLANAFQDKGIERRMIFTGLTEAFFTYVKVALFSAFFLGFPLIATQAWLFIAPGLYRDEKRAFLPFLIATPVMFFLGGALAYYFVFPLAWRFFLSFEVPAGEGMLPIQLEAKVDQYLGIVMQLIFAFGLCFEMPVLLVLLARVGIIDVADLKQKRRYAVVIAFVAAAVLTPPDVISQISLALPLILLYELSILVAGMVAPKPADGEADAAGDAENDDDEYPDDDDDDDDKPREK